MKSFWTFFLSAVVVASAARATAQAESDPKALYRMYCASCHGIHMEGGLAQSLVDAVWAVRIQKEPYRSKHQIWDRGLFHARV